MFDPTYPDIDMEMFEKKDWRSMHGMGTEPMQETTPKAVGNEFIIRIYVDASFEGCKVTRWSRTGFIVYLNGVPIYYMSKKQGLQIIIQTY